MILVLGDIHNNFAHVKWYISNKEISNCYIIQVGDFGVGTNIKNDIIRLNDLNVFLKERNIVLYAIRGNHDDPDFFKGNHILSNVKLLPDYTQLEIDGHNILFVGGAISIDRRVSLEKMAISKSVGQYTPLYWIGEEFILDEEKLSNVRDIDMVITHSAPEWCFPNVSNGFGYLVMEFAKNDDKLLNELDIERKKFNKMFEILNKNNDIRKHYYGHFHRNEVTLNGYTEHILVGVGDFEIVDRYTDEEYKEIFK